MEKGKVCKRKIRIGSYRHVIWARENEWDASYCFMIGKYSGCVFCGANSERYCIVDADGRILTFLNAMPRSFLNYFIRETYLFCDDCVQKVPSVTITEEKRNYLTYYIDDDIEDFLPEPSAEGKRIVERLAKN